MARAYIPQLIPLLVTGHLDPTRLITHRLPLAEAPAGYKSFDRKEENALKVLLKP